MLMHLRSLKCSQQSCVQATLEQEQAEKAGVSEKAKELQEQLEAAQNDLKDERETAAALGEQLIDLSHNLESAQKDYELAANRAATLQKGVLLALSKCKPQQALQVWALEALRIRQVPYFLQ